MSNQEDSLPPIDVDDAGKLTGAVPTTTSQQRQRRHEARVARLRREKRHRRRKTRGLRRALSVVQQRAHQILEAPIGLVKFYADSIGVKKAKKKKPGAIERIEFPAIFSFIDNPDGTLEFFREFLHKALKAPRELWFDQRPCESVDFCAAALLNVIAKDLRNERKIGGFGGNLPQQPALAEIIRATGLPDAIGISYGGKTSFRRHKMRMGKRGAGSSINDRNNETTKLVEYLDACLGDFGFSLPLTEGGYLADIVGEVIDNAERHSGRTQWWIGGYLRGDSAFQGDCHIVIFNFGHTIASSLRQLPKTSILRQRILGLIQLHEATKLFGRSWTEENLWTLYAMQEGVSRNNRGTKRDRVKDAGQGTVDMAQYFQELGTTDPVMCLVSGHTYIRFDSTFKIAPSDPTDPNSYKVIAFNNENDLTKPPDPAAVRHLENFFPGTLLSLRFTITREVKEIPQ